MRLRYVLLGLAMVAACPKDKDGDDDGMDSADTGGIPDDSSDDDGTVEDSGQGFAPETCEDDDPEGQNHARVNAASIGESDAVDRIVCLSDWYAIEVAADMSVIVSVSYDAGDDGNVDLELFDSTTATDPVDESKNEAIDDQVSFPNQGTEATTYYVQVSVDEDHDDDGVEYELSISFQDASECVLDANEPEDCIGANECRPGALTLAAGTFDLTMCDDDDDDEDWLKITVPDGQRFTVTPTYTVPDGEVLQILGEVEPVADIGATVFFDNVWSSGESRSYENVETNAGDRELLMRVAAPDVPTGGFEYTLTITLEDIQ